MGNRIKTKPKIKIKNSLPKSWLPELIELARSYPYEQKRKKLQQIDIAHQVEASLCSDGNSRFITALREEQPVGLIKISASPLHSKVLDQKIYTGSWELIKNNNNEIRRAIFQKLRKEFSGTRINFQQPGANKTACQLFERMEGYQYNTQEILMYRTLDPAPKKPADPGEEFNLVDGSEINEKQLEKLINHYHQGHLFQFPGYADDKVWKIYWRWLTAIRRGENSHEAALVHENGRLAGYCLVKTNNSPFSGVNSGTVSYLQVHPDFKSQGLGSFLLREGLHILGRQNTGYVELKTSHQNKVAVDFYQKFGFETISRRIHFSLRPAG